MKAKRFLSALLCAALVLALLPAGARAAGPELVVTHTTAGNLTAEITAALGANPPGDYTKIKINIGTVALSGRYNSGDWQTLCNLTGTLPNASELELAYTAGSHTIADNAMYSSAPWLNTLTLTNAGGTLTGIGHYAFQGTGLTGTLTIPSSVTSIGAWAFNGCSGLDALLFRNDASAPTMGIVITDQPLTAYYPAAAEASYTSQAGFPTNRAAYDGTTARLTHFRLGGARGIISEAAKAVTLSLPTGTDLTSLAPDIGFIGASISPASGAAQDFSALSRTYTVTPASGSTAAYTVYILSSPSVSGSNALSGSVGGVGEKTVTASVSGSLPGGEITLTATIDALTATATRTGDGEVTFTFAAAGLNALPLGSYDILVSSEATAYNAAIPSTKVGTLTVGVPSSDAALSGLSISEGTLTPGFASGTYAYTASVGNSVSSLSVTPTASDANATITVNGTAITSGTASGDIALTVGANTVTIVVTAQDGTTAQTYTVSVTRADNSSPTYHFRFLRDPATGVTVSGDGIHTDAQLTVSPLAPHGANCKACEAIRKATAAGRLILGFNIELSHGFIGEITLSLPVGSQYDGQTVTLLHCVNGRLEAVTVTAANGMATFTTAELSPVAAVSGPYDKSIAPPQTGGGVPPWGFTLIGLALVCAGRPAWRRFAAAGRRKTAK